MTGTKRPQGLDGALCLSWFHAYSLSPEWVRVVRRRELANVARGLRVGGVDVECGLVFLFCLTKGKE